MIRVMDLSKVYEIDGTETHALRGVTFEIKKGEFVSIMGPSGSGKSTLLHVLSFLDRPTGGEYHYMGKDMRLLTDIELARIRNESMGFVFQAFNLLGRLSVYENVQLPLFYSDVPVAKRDEMVKSAVASVGLTDKLSAEASRLSGGEKQRVAIARALVNNPDIIFADEPTGNLDSESGAQIMEIFDELNNDGRTVILVTHETYTAEFAGRLLKMKDGKIESDEPVKKRRQGREEFMK
ncbi:MAG: ABC transporter ATP-binding protein [Candidatus Liptonbacteria bacterium]|nr:ABC transporter ATP-binding protein [Candidatus Liptonbacteria bacterium]